jgi:hypothetical protein
MTDITPPPPHLLKKFSEQARVSSQKRGAPNYLKTFATLCIEWAMNSKPTPNPSQIRSSDITPLPELVEHWRNQAPEGMGSQAREMWIATCAAQWGADMELEACCEWLGQKVLLQHQSDVVPALRAARRPKPPSLKEQALMALEDGSTVPGASLTSNEVDIIRRALKALPDD